MYLLISTADFMMLNLMMESSGFSTPKLNWPTLFPVQMNVNYQPLSG